MFIVGWDPWRTHTDIVSVLVRSAGFKNKKGTNKLCAWVLIRSQNEMG